MTKPKSLILDKIDKQEIPLRLFLYAIREDDTLVDFLKKTTVKRQDLQEFRNLTVRFGLLPQIYLKLLSKNISQTLPKDFLSALKSNYYRHLAGNLRLLAALDKIDRIFSENKIQTILFKGPASSYLAYNDCLLRSYSDIDLMIKKNDLIKIHKLLKENGFIFPIPSSRRILTHIRNTGRDLNASREILHLDIHQQIAKGPHYFRIHTATWDRKIKIKINNRHYFTFSIEDTIHHLAIHSAKDGWNNCKTLLDLGQLIRMKGIDWDYLVKLAEGSKTLLILKIALRFLPDFFNISLPAQALALIEGCNKTERQYTNFYNRLFKNKFQLDILTWYSTIPKCLDTQIASISLYLWFLTHPSPQLHPKFFKLPQPFFSIYKFFAPFYLTFQYKNKLFKRRFKS
jgi:hypothetical protein